MNGIFESRPCGILFSVNTMETELSKRRPGGNIDCWCGKCKLILAHTIEAMVGSKPVRVHCNTCQSQHSYRATAPGVRATKQGEAGATRTAKPRANRYQALLSAKAAQVAKAYSPSDRYEVGDVLEHSTFGRGVAMVIKDGMKVEVLFESGSKTLVHGR